MRAGRILVVVAALALAACEQASAEPTAYSHDFAAIDARRDAFRRPDVLVAQLGLRAGERVADVGAGDGYLSYRLAAAVGPQGHVVATDIDPSVLPLLVARGAGAKIEIRLVTPDAPGLEAHAYDLILLAEVDHYLDHRVAYLQELATALAPGGRLVISNRAPYRAAALDAATRAGFTLRREASDLPEQFVFVFTKELP